MSRQFNGSELPYQLSYLLSQSEERSRSFELLDTKLRDDIISRSENITNKYQLESLERELKRLIKR